jgi:hypothetical protein
VTHVSSVSSHDCQIVVVDDLLHLLYATEVSQHVTNRDDVAVLDKTFGDRFGSFDSSGSDGLRVSFVLHLGVTTNLLNKVGSLREVLDQVQFEICSLGSSTSVSGWATNDDCAEPSASFTSSGDSAYLGKGAPELFKAAW